MLNFIKASFFVLISLGSTLSNASNSKSEIPLSSLDNIAGLVCEIDAQNIATVVWANNSTEAVSKDLAIGIRFVDVNGNLLDADPVTLFPAKDILAHRMAILGRIPAPAGAHGCYNPYKAPAPMRSAGCHLTDGKAQMQVLWAASRFRIDGTVQALYFDENADLIDSDSFPVKTESFAPGTYMFAERVVPAKTKFCMWVDIFQIVKWN